MCGMYDEPFNRDDYRAELVDRMAEIRANSPLRILEEIPKGAMRYNKGKLRWSLYPLEAIEGVVRVLEYGAHKYSIFEGEDGQQIKGIDISKEEAERRGLKKIKDGANNWREGDGLTIQGCWDSFLRHFVALQSGEECDPESGLPHRDHMGCNLMFISYLEKHKK